MFSHIVLLIATPILTRIYSPTEFGILAVYNSFLNILSVIICLRFEIAIPLPKTDKTAAALLILSLISTFIITFLIAIIFFFFDEEINKITKNQLANIGWLLPVGVFFTGVFTSFQYWSIRKKEFSIIAKTRVIQAMSSSIFQIVFGLFHAVALGLVIGQVMKVSAGWFVLLRNFVKRDLQNFFQISWQEIIISFKDYDRFPKYSALEGIANVSAIQVPIILIAFYSLNENAGIVMLAMQLLMVPLALIGQSVSQVYLSEATDKYHQGDLRLFTHSIILKLIKISILPMIMIIFIAPIIVPLVFGDKWNKLGYVISWMVPWFFMQFITSPVSMCLHITSNSQLALKLHILGFVLRTMGVLCAAFYFNEFMIEVYAITGLLFYFIYLLVILHVLRDSSRLAL